MARTTKSSIRAEAKRIKRRAEIKAYWLKKERKYRSRMVVEYDPLNDTLMQKLDDAREIVQKLTNATFEPVQMDEAYQLSEYEVLGM
ncbi:hypothetical protein L915_08854 [Phytophthora nicotianae]|uniref:Uncharacterized protein n=1 Tax=Phytophthora nicotianae TaxID=4792 RepID=W2GUI3_PHYNI|nr:hypothetical protein L915_08854 [Phytophthora nicotianae]